MTAIAASPAASFDAAYADSSALSPGGGYETIEGYALEAPRTPEEALGAIIRAAEADIEIDHAAARALTLIADADAPMTRLFLEYAEQALAAGVETRLVLARRRRPWSWRRAEAPADALETLGVERVRMLDAAAARGYFTQAAFGFMAVWAGPRLCQSRHTLGSGLAGGGFLALLPNEEGRARAARAHVSFEAVWSAARPV